MVSSSSCCCICLEAIDDDEGAPNPCGFQSTDCKHQCFHRKCLKKYYNTESYDGRCPHCNVQIHDPKSKWNIEIKNIEKIQNFLKDTLECPSQNIWKKKTKYFEFKEGSLQRSTQEKRVIRNIVSYSVEMMHKHHVGMNSCVRVLNMIKSPFERRIICRNTEKKYEIRIQIKRTAFYSVVGGIQKDGYEMSLRSVRI